MTADGYPKCIIDLPKAKIPFLGVKGWIAQGESSQTVFFEIEPIGEVTPHSHGAQFGIVIEGEMQLTVGEITNTYTKGDSYFIPEGIVHHATFNTFCRVMDYFAEPDRYEHE